MICSSNVFFINNPDLDPYPKLWLKPDPDPKKRQQFVGSTTLLSSVCSKLNPLGRLRSKLTQLKRGHSKLTHLSRVCGKLTLLS
jgi:hypothetical protein